jgi:cytosine/adenosine deaminase-related metal-dependent hydrolase
MLLGKFNSGTGALPARDALEMATRDGAACLGRTGELGELSVGAAGDVVAWNLDGPAFAGVLDDPIEGWLRCGPLGSHHTIVAGRPVVQAGHVVSPKLEEKLSDHKRISRRFQPT